MIGPLGSILAIPLTLLTKALLVDIDPRTRWLNHLLSSSPPDAAPGPETNGQAGPSRCRGVRSSPVMRQTRLLITCR